MPLRGWVMCSSFTGVNNCFCICRVTGRRGGCQRQKWGHFVIQFPPNNQLTDEEIRHMPIAIIVHGGAGNVAAEYTDAVQAGCKEAALTGWRILQAGGSALDAVEAAVRSLEDNP